MRSTRWCSDASGAADGALFKLCIHGCTMGSHMDTGAAYGNTTSVHACTDPQLMNSCLQLGCLYLPLRFVFNSLQNHVQTVAHAWHHRTVVRQGKNVKSLNPLQSELLKQFGAVKGGMHKKANPGNHSDAVHQTSQLPQYRRPHHNSS